MNTQDRTDAVHISEDVDSARQFVLHPSDNDVFVRNGLQVIEGCRLTISVSVWLDECRSMTQMVAEWAKRHDQVAECYLVMRRSGVAFFFVPKTDSFDFDLASKLVDLDRTIEKFNVGPVELYQVPGDELQRFVTPDSCRQVYHADSPHNAVEA